MIAALGLLMVGTAFLSGLFGMAGGLILIGVLLALMPLPTAMVLHAITQMASNGWRAFLWRGGHPRGAGGGGFARGRARPPGAAGRCGWGGGPPPVMGGKSRSHCCCWG